MLQADLHQALYRWYKAQGRHDLPWRQTDDAYKIWVSEVMLQQTQVKTVLERFYFPFLEAFPSIADLANADLQTVLKLWQGLGYYNRARNLHRAAQQLHQSGRNTLPSDVEALLTLPGIGKNTAHAVASLAFHQPVPVLEANVKRVLARFYAHKNINESELWQRAFDLLDKANPFDYNQAMMDVGSLLCLPKTPYCSSCPLSSQCVGKHAPENYPKKTKKAALPIRKTRFFALENPQGKFAVRSRKGKFLHGLWEFPQCEEEDKSLAFGTLKISADNKQKCGQFIHTYSHFKLDATLHHVNIESCKAEDWQWKNLDEIAQLPLSRTEKKIIATLAKKRETLPAQQAS